MSVGPIAPPPGGQGVTSVATNSDGGSPSAAPVPNPQASPAQATGLAAVALASPEAALVAAAGEAALAQDGLGPLLADLAAAQDAPGLPTAARATLQQILAAQTPLTGDVTAQDLRGAVQGSGLFLEAALAAAVQGQNAPNSATDLKALLVRLAADLDPALQVQLAALEEAASPPASQPGMASRRAGLRPSPPIRGALPAGQAAVPPSAELAAEPWNAPRILRQDAQAALARLQLSQLASLPKADGGIDWTFELPIATPSGPAIAQFEISRDGHGADAPDAPQPAWRARFSLDAEPGGPVHADISLSGGRTRVTLWAERDGAWRRLDSERGALQAALAGPEGADAAVRVLPGAPVPAPLSPAGHFLDRTS